MPQLPLPFAVLLSFLAVSQDGSSAVGNIGLWLSLFLGDGILVSLYMMEHFARENCAQVIVSAVSRAMWPREGFPFP